jgi:hyperosmotically inducible periplasmic protein
MRLTRLSACVALLATAVLVNCAATPTRESTGEAVDDSTITAKVKAELVQDHETKARDIGVQTYRGVVQLSGFVGSDAERQEAEKDASQVAGVRSVQNELKVNDQGTTVGTTIDDSAITAKVEAALVGNPTTKAREIKVTTSHGVVELSGFVDSNEEKDTAAQLASAVHGVKGVDNELQLKPAQ